MYIHMGMFFNSKQDVPDFGSIAMYYVGTKDLGYVEEGHKRFRKYTFQSTDLSKLSLITNAIDGSEAFAVDTGTTYVLYDGQWSIKSSELTPAKMAEILGDITSIDYQIVNSLPITGVKGTIYLIAHQTAQEDYYDEYIWTNGTYEKMGNTAPTISTMIGSTINSQGTAGLVPTPPTGTQNHYLSGDGTWKSTMVGATKSTNGSTGLVPAPSAGKQDYYLSGDGTWKSSYFINITYNYATSKNWITNSHTDLNKIITPGLYRIAAYNGAASMINGPDLISSGFGEMGVYLQVKTFEGHLRKEGIQIITDPVGHIYTRQWLFSYDDYNIQFSQWELKDSIPIVTEKTGQIPKFKADGTLESTGFTLAKSVPADAVFTDTTYTLVQDQLDGHKMTFTPSNGNATIITIPDNNTTYEDATQSAHGLMSASDKTKLDGININNYSMKSDAVVCTEDEYNSLATKTAKFYYIIQED